MRTFVKTMLAVLTALIPTVAHAGPGATIYGCIYLPSAPPTTWTVNFTPVGNHCMNSSGANASVPISAAGVTCAPLGYVEAKASTTPFEDTCGSDDSVWTLAYNILNTGYSGSTGTDWPKNFLGIGSNHFYLINQSSNTVVCGSPGLCGLTSVTWDSASSGPIYIIFQPQS